MNPLQTVWVFSVVTEQYTASATIRLSVQILTLLINRQRDVSDACQGDDVFNPDSQPFLRGGSLSHRLQERPAFNQPPIGTDHREVRSRHTGKPAQISGIRPTGEPFLEESVQFHYLRLTLLLELGRALYTVLADVVATGSMSDGPTPESLAKLDRMPRTLTLEVTPAGNRQEIPTGFEQAITGTMVMFTMIVLLTSGAVTLIIERRQGLLRRLASTPIDRGGIVLGKWSGRLALGLVQIAFAMLAGTLLFGMDWGPNLPMIFAVLTVWAALCASSGLLLGNLARTEGQAIGVGVLTSNVLAALWGCWWPIEITPDWMQTFSKLLPTGWAMDAMHRLVSFQAGPASVLPHLAALAALSLIAGWIGARRFRFQ